MRKISIALSIFLIFSASFLFNGYKVETSSNSSAVSVKMYRQPTVEWIKTCRGAAWDVACSAVHASDGGYASAGMTESYGTGGGDFWSINLKPAPVKDEWWSTPTQLTNNTAWDANPSISGDGSKIAFVSDLDGDSEVFVVNSDGSELKQLTNNTAHDERPSISDDGSKIAFMSDLDGDYDIFLVDSDGSGLKQLTNNTAWDANPSISGDGSKIAFVSDLDGDSEVFVVNSDGSELKQLTNNTAHDADPSISGDGSKIAFVSDLDGDHEIFVVDSDGSRLKQLTNNNVEDVYPSISGDGSKITFVSTLDGDHEIFVVRSNGGGLRQLTNNTAWDAFPSISGDERKIAFVSDLDGDYEIFLVDSDGSGLKQLTNNTAHDERPSISDDGSKIAFMSDLDGDYEIFVVSQDLNSPVTVDDYSDQWHTTDFTITLEATDDLSGVAETYYKVNNGPTKSVRADGQPSITTEGANNKLEYWSVDNAGNEELPHKILTGIKLDKTAPRGSILINDNATYANSTSVTLALTATDVASGVHQVRFSNDGVWDTEPWENPISTKTWTITLGDGEKTVYYQLRDNAGLISSTYSDAIILDTVPPAGSVTINEGATYTTTTTVTLTLSATDTTSGVAEMRFSNDDLTYTDWQTYAPSNPWSLTDGDGARTVYVQFRDHAGLVSTYSDTIILDVVQPTGSITIAEGSAYTNFTSVTLTLSAEDATSGVTQMRFSHDNATWTPWEPYATPRAWTLTTSDGTKTVYAQFKDNAGLASKSYFDTIILDTTAPTIQITSPSPGYEIRSSTVAVTWTGSDDASGISYYEIRLDGGSWINVGTSITHTFTGLGDGSHTIDIKATDKAGYTKQDTVSFTVNTSPLFGPGYMEEAILAIIIIALGTAMYLLKIRKHGQTS